jgi:hypothetical protein
MTDETRPPLSRRLQRRAMPALFRVLNVPMRSILSLPIATPLGKRLMLVYLTGRKTGRQYRQPVSYVRDAETLLTPGGGAGRSTSSRGNRHTSGSADATSRSAPSSYATQPRSTGCSES